MSIDKNSLFFNGDFLVLIAGCLVAAGLTVVIKGLAQRFAIMDLPDRVQCSHTRATPRGGGLAFVLVFLCGLWGLFANRFISHNLFWGLMVGGLLVAGISLKDDHGGVSVSVRFMFHVLAAGWFLWAIGGTPLSRFVAPAVWAAQGNVGQWADLLLGNFLGTVILVWFINLLNFIDGLDGLAGSQALFMAGLGALLFYLRADLTSAFLCLLLIAAIMGFLIWNWPPAQIFMGDVGSCFLGFVLGALALSGIRAATVPLPIWLILTGVAFTDTTVTLVRRVVRGERWWESHHKFAFQHSARLLGGHLKVTTGALAIDGLWLAPLAMAAWRWPAHGLLFTCMALMPLGAGALYLGAGVDYPGHKKTRRGHVTALEAASPSPGPAVVSQEAIPLARQPGKALPLLREQTRRRG